MTEFRCKEDKCGKLLFMFSRVSVTPEQGVEVKHNLDKNVIEIKCNRCKKINTIAFEELEAI